MDAVLACVFCVPAERPGRRSFSRNAALARSMPISVERCAMTSASGVRSCPASAQCSSNSNASPVDVVDGTHRVEAGAFAARRGARGEDCSGSPRRRRDAGELRHETDFAVSRSSPTASTSGSKLEAGAPRTEQSRLAGEETPPARVRARLAKLERRRGSVRFAAAREVLRLKARLP